jgi:hypothetical protein
MWLGFCVISTQLQDDLAEARIGSDDGSVSDGENVRSRSSCGVDALVRMNGRAVAERAEVTMRTSGWTSGRRPSESQTVGPYSTHAYVEATSIEPLVKAAHLRQNAAPPHVECRRKRQLPATPVSHRAVVVMDRTPRNRCVSHNVSRKRPWLIPHSRSRGALSRLRSVAEQVLASNFPPATVVTSVRTRNQCQAEPSSAP